MFGRIAKYLTFSNVIACLALFVALGGSVYAAGKISGKQIKPSSLPGNRIKPKTLPPNRIKPNSLARQADQRADAHRRQRGGPRRRAVPGGDGEVVEQRQTDDHHGQLWPRRLRDRRRGDRQQGRSGLRQRQRAEPAANRLDGHRYSWSFIWRPTMTVTAVCVVVQKPGGRVDNVTGETLPGGPVYETGG